LKTGALALICDLFLQVDNEKTQKKPALACPMATVGHNTHQMMAASGLQHSPGPPPLGDKHGIVPVHSHGHQNGQQSWSIYSLLFYLLSPGQPPGHN
jgi:hypothetical protein